MSANWRITIVQPQPAPSGQGTPRAHSGKPRRLGRRGALCETDYCSQPWCEDEREAAAAHTAAGEDAKSTAAACRGGAMLSTV